MREALTVIVPVYNAAAYLDECVGGIVPQLWPGCRLILVDDGSNDGSEAMSLKFASAHPDIIETVRTDNVGVSEARNIGISMATTPLLAFCDADDTYNPGALGLMADIIGQSRSQRPPRPSSTLSTNAPAATRVRGQRSTGGRSSATTAALPRADATKTSK